MLASRVKGTRIAFCNTAIFCQPSTRRTYQHSSCRARLSFEYTFGGAIPIERRGLIHRVQTVLRFQKPPSNSGSGGGRRWSGGGGGGGGDGGDWEDGLLQRLISLYIGALNRRPILTKSTSTLALGLAGDYCAQRLAALQKQEDFKLEVRRLLSVGAFSFCFMGPAMHFWYGLLDRVYYRRFAALYKVVTDQAFFAPCFNASFIIGVGALEGNTASDIRDNVSQKWWPSMKANWMIWPAAQAINFGLVPKNWQILYVNGVGFVWNIILTKIAHNKSNDVETKVAV